MEQTESRTHSFIIKIWLEEEMDESSRTMWRGHITHVPSGKRHYIQDVNAILSFIQPYLEQLGAGSSSDGREKINSEE
jgi:hypothetical protein